MTDPFCGRLDDVLARHRAFWHRTPADRPLLAVNPWQEYGFYDPFPCADGSPIPDRTALRPGAIGTRLYLERIRPASWLDGDFIQSWVVYDVCWMEAMVGCQVVTASGTTWAEHFLSDWSRAPGLVDPRGGPWLEELVRAHRVLADMAGDDSPVGQPLMRGPADMALAALGSERFCSGFYEHPDELAALLDACTRLRVEATVRRLEVLPAFHGGYCTRDVWGLWAPGPLIDFQEDAGGLLSPRLYRQHIAPLDREMARRFPYSIVHLHSGQLQMLPAVLDIPELTAVQIAIDPPPYAAPAGTLMSQLRSVQDAGKSLLVVGPMTRDELERMLAELSPTGLAIRAALLNDSRHEIRQ